MLRVKEIKHNGNTMWADTAYIVATPVVSCTNNVVTMTCSTSDATIRYSTNGGSTWQTYSSSITISETTTYNAYATKSGMIDSAQTSYTATYVKPTLPNPTVTKLSQRYSYNYKITVEFKTSGVSGVVYYIKYDTGGAPTSNPTTSSYDRKLTGTGNDSTVSSEFTDNNSSPKFYFKVLATKEGYNNSNIVSKQLNYT